MIFKILSIYYGWFSVDINRQCVLTNSDFMDCDAPALLLGAFTALLQKKDSVEWLCWQGEPRAQIVKLQRKDDLFLMQVYDSHTESTELDYCGNGLEQHISSCIYETEDKLIKTAQTILTEFSLYENGTGYALYSKHWGSFPKKEYGMLKEILRHCTTKNK